MTDAQEIIDRCLKFGTPTYVAAADLIEQLITENAYLREALQVAHLALGENDG